MTTCQTIQPRLTAYLDGELAGEHGSVVRGHLRECAACREIARDEAALRDGLRLLPPVDPPVALWAGIQAQLAAAEVADARKSPWRRSLARWARWAPWPPTIPQYVTGGALAAAAVVMLYWRTQRPVDVAEPVVAVPVPEIQSARIAERSKSGGSEGNAAAVVPVAPVAPVDDVTADLAAEPARITAAYAATADELMTLARDASAGWSDRQRAAFDDSVAALRAGIDRASAGRPRQRAQRALIRYLQGAAVRDVVLLASGGAR